MALPELALGAAAAAGVLLGNGAAPLHHASPMQGVPRMGLGSS